MFFRQFQQAALRTATAAFFICAALAVLLVPGNPVSEPALVYADVPSKKAPTLAMFGGTPVRNMVNLIDKNIPAQWQAAWKTVQQNGREVKVLDSANSKHVKWAVKLGSRAYGGPVVADGRIFVGTNNEEPRNPAIKGDKGILMCFRASDGEFLWQAVHPKLESGPVNDWPREGICSTPAIEGERVYYVNNRCEVVCADARGGANREAKILWTFDMMKQLNVFPHNMSACCPLVHGNLVYVVTSNGVDEEHISLPSPDAPSFIALDKNTGKLVWRDNSPGKNIMHGQWSNPSLLEVNGKAQVVFPGGDGWLRGFDPKTGEVLWRFDANPKDSKYELGGKGTRSDFIATPVIHDGKIYIGTGQDPEHYEGVAHFWCINPAGKRGDISPDLVVDHKVWPPKTKTNPHSAVVWHFGGPVQKADENRTKRDYYFGRTMSTVAIQDGLVYAGELAGYLHCLDAKTGKEYWNYDLKAGVWGSAYWVDGKVFIATEEGDVYVFDHGKEMKAPRKVEMEQAIRSTITAADGVLYVMTESYLYAIAAK